MTKSNSNQPSQNGLPTPTTENAETVTLGGLTFRKIPDEEGEAFFAKPLPKDSDTGSIPLPRVSRADFQGNRIRQKRLLVWKSPLWWPSSNHVHPAWLPHRNQNWPNQRKLGRLIWIPAQFFLFLPAFHGAQFVINTVAPLGLPITQSTAGKRGILLRCNASTMESCALAAKSIES